MTEVKKLYQTHVHPYIWHRWFLVILSVKVIFSFSFATDVLAKGFIPFLSYFVESGFNNPYDYFLDQGALKAFPYSTIMLWILAVPRAIFSPLLSDAWQVVTPLHLFVTRIPVLFADIVIYLILCIWLPTREKRVLVLYWASPLLFYINYFHGQLDVIPTAILFVSLALLFIEREWFSYALLGIGIAAKAHLLAALPFYVLYSYVKKRPRTTIVQYCIITLFVYVVLLVPYFFSNGYKALVLHAEEQGWIFRLQLPYGDGNVALLIAPVLYLVLFFRFASYRKMTPDLFLVVLGLVFSVLVIFVPPMPGWFYWSLPFLAYFYIKKPEAPTLNFWLLQGAFLGYFFLHTSDLFRAFQVITPSIALLPSLSILLVNWGVNTPLVTNIFFTALEAAMIMNVVWCYKVGVRDSFTYKEQAKPLLIGIGGDSGAGKSTLTGILARLFHERRVVCVRGDDAHRWPRGHQNWQVFTHLDPKSNRLHEDLTHAIALKAGHPVERVHYDHATGTFANPEPILPHTVILFEGLHPYYIKRTRDLFDMKIFVEPAEELRVHWKLIRDMEERGHSRETILAQLDERRADAQRYIHPQKEFADVVVKYVPVQPLTAPGMRGVMIPLRLEITFDNSLDIESLVTLLTSVNTLAVEYVYEDVDTITLTVEGEITAIEIERIAYHLIPNLQELTHTKPAWEDGLDGVLQLFTLYYLSETAKLKAYDV